MRRSNIVLLTLLLIVAAMPLIVSGQTRGNGKRYAYGKHHTVLIGRRDRGLHRGWVVGRHRGWTKNGRTPPSLRRGISFPTVIGIGRGKGRGRGPK